ncbi:MAG: hypothetical protein H0T13_10110 [Actinobacteria bacterium]|nr:hypothetical protein [Actinomycetota bacterium]
MLPGGRLCEARRRFAAIDRELAPGASFTAGFAERAAAETADDLIARAGRTMLDARDGGRLRAARPPVG